METCKIRGTTQTLVSRTGAGRQGNIFSLRSRGKMSLTSPLIDQDFAPVWFFRRHCSELISIGTSIKDRLRSADSKAKMSDLLRVGGCDSSSNDQNGREGAKRRRRTAYRVPLRLARLRQCRDPSVGSRKVDWLVCRSLR
jgi:hypothetical protein